MSDSLRAFVVFAILLVCVAPAPAEDAPTQKEALRELGWQERSIKLTYQAIGQRKEVVAAELDRRVNLTPRLLACLGALPRLEALSVAEIELIDRKESLAALGKLTNLRSLGLKQTYVDADGLRELRGLRKLEALDLSENPSLADNEVVGVMAFKNLRSLSLRDTAVTDAGLFSLGKLAKLETLDLWSAKKITDRGLPHLSKLPLRRLVLSRTKVTDAGLAGLAGTKTLEELDLDSTEVTDKGVPHLRDLPALRSLTLTLCSGADVDTLPRLRRLRVPGLIATEAGMKAIARCKLLEDLTLSGDELTDALLAHLVGCKPLRSLSVSSDAVTDKGVAALTAHAGLARLSLSCSAVTDKGVAALAAHARLEELDLAGSAATDGCLASLGKMRSLKVVRLNFTKVTPRGVRGFAKEHPKVRVDYNFPSRDDDD